MFFPFFRPDWSDLSKPIWSLYRHFHTKSPSIQGGYILSQEKFNNQIQFIIETLGSDSAKPPWLTFACPWLLGLAVSTGWTLSQLVLLRPPLSPFQRWAIWGLGRLCNMSKVIPLVSSRARILPRSVYSSESVLSHCPTLQNFQERGISSFVHKEEILSGRLGS